MKKRYYRVAWWEYEPVMGKWTPCAMAIDCDPVAWFNRAREDEDHTGRPRGPMVLWQWQEITRAQFKACKGAAI